MESFHLNKNKLALAFLMLVFYILISLFSTGQNVLSDKGNQNPVNNKGLVIEGLKMESKILDYDINYSIYLPADYEYSTRRYPVVYLLHGFSGDETSWIQSGEINATADKAIENSEIPPMIIVMPNAKVTLYINDFAGTNLYEDAIFKEFIPFIDKTYRTRAKKHFRAVAGLSMGGYGSLIWSLQYPELFIACAAFSPGVHTDQELMDMPEEKYRNWFKDIYGVGNSRNRITSYWKKNSVLELLKTLPVDQIEKVNFYIDCGDDDFLFRGNSMLHLIMSEREINHEYRVRDGAHKWVYWRNNIIEGLKFIGDHFHD